MALDALRCNHLAPLSFKGLTQRTISGRNTAWKPVSNDENDRVHERTYIWRAETRKGPKTQ